VRSLCSSWSYHASVSAGPTAILFASFAIPCIVCSDSQLGKIPGMGSPRPWASWRTLFAYIGGIVRCYWTGHAERGLGLVVSPVCQNVRPGQVELGRPSSRWDANMKVN
jgi:hypothetical protein